MAGDRVTSEDGSEVEFPNTRAGRAPRVVPQRFAILGLVGGLVTGGGSTATVANFVFKAAVQQEIRAHDKDPEAHALLVRAMERVQQSANVDDAEKARLQAQLDAMTRDLRDVREAVIRLEAQLKRSGR